MTESTSCEFDLITVPKSLHTQFASMINDVIVTKIGPEYKAKGYTVETKTYKPWENDKKVPEDIRDLPGYHAQLQQGMYIGTEIQITWNKKERYQLELSVKEDTKLFTILCVICSIFFTILAYGLTVIFYQYWFIVFVTLFICFCLTFLMAVLPLVVGIGLGFGVAFILKLIITPKEAKNIS